MAVVSAGLLLTGALLALLGSVVVWASGRSSFLGYLFAVLLLGGPGVLLTVGALGLARRRRWPGLLAAVGAGLLVVEALVLALENRGFLPMLAVAIVINAPIVVLSLWQRTALR